MATLRKTAFEKSCKKVSTSEWSNQKLWTFWAGTLVWSVVWPNQTLGVSSSDFIAMPRKTASENSCKNPSTIQRSNQKLWTSWADTLVRSVVWPDQTPLTSRSDFSASPRKTTSRNSCKNLSSIQRLDQELWTFWVCTLVWSVVWHDQTMSVSSSKYIATLRKTTSETFCNNPAF
jgi:hypothetical protein